jgi:hypothetical protein
MFSSDYALTFMLSKTSITDFTAFADSSNNAFSSAFNCNSMIFSIPFLPPKVGIILVSENNRLIKNIALK